MSFLTIGSHLDEITPTLPTSGLLVLVLEDLRGKLANFVGALFIAWLVVIIEKGLLYFLCIVEVRTTHLGDLVSKARGEHEWRRLLAQRYVGHVLYERVARIHDQTFLVPDLIIVHST